MYGYFVVAGEKQQLEELRKRREKKQQKLAAKGITKQHKRKNIRIRKGVVVKVSSLICSTCQH